jgi:hypothetical protein
MTICAVDVLLKEHQTTVLRERRAVDRQPFVRPVRVITQRGGTVIEGFTRDISRNGISILLPQEVHPGMIVILEIHSLFGQPLAVRAENRWCDPFGDGWYSSGWYFIESF